MAYQVGMQQLTGQEMDHQLERIKQIFKDSKIRENIIMFYFASGCGLIINLTLLGIFIIPAVFLYDERD
jgi:hypothetical protein